MFPLLTFAALSLGAEDGPPPVYADRWVYCASNLQVEKNVDELVALINRSKAAGYTGVVLADYKLNILDRVPDHYFRNAKRVKQAADVAGLEIIPAVFPIGYSNGLLAHDPNLAEGLPVRNAPYVARGGKAVLESAVSLANGGFEDARGDKARGLAFQDGAGSFTFVDKTVAAAGKQSLRIQDANENCRVACKIAVRPFACYRMSAKLKTKDFRAKGEFRLLALGKGGRSLTFFDDAPKADQDWTEAEVMFNSLDADEVTAYVGCWGGLKGSLWVDDWKVEELSLVNVLRRDGCPLAVTSADGKTAYEEGRDFRPVRDPKLGTVPYAGEYDFRHAGPQITLTPDSRIRDGEGLLVSYYHPAIIHGSQVGCSLTDPKVFTLLEDQARRVRELFRPKTWFMSHDEIRVAGWSADGANRTPGRQLADNARRCVQILRSADPKCRIAVWSDMFDPHHNATDKYYLVNGSLADSWEGLPSDVIVANWNGGHKTQSLKFFAGRGHEQIIAGYYDHDLSNFQKWDEAARGVRGVRGFMYTTWQHKYTLLEPFGRALRRE